MSDERPGISPGLYRLMLFLVWAAVVVFAAVIVLLVV
jgi:hypothetical protein